MFSEDLLCKIALTMVPQVGPVQARILLQHFDAPGIFKAKRKWLEKMEGIGSFRADAIRNFSDFSLAEEELKFTDRHGIKVLCLTDKEYPQRLLHCNDAPVVLYYKGEADLNVPRMIAVIGTRNHSAYGRQITEKLVDDLRHLPVTIVSGLAYGIDAIAHQAALKNQLPTIGVLAHGLHTIYPYAHTQLSREMQRNGALLTEFNSQEKPDRHNFPIRNRIVAGMCDATVVVETGVKGGSMITAELANGYNRDVFAFPGKTTDPKSEGCNYLIRNNKAVLLTQASELVGLMGWEERSAKPKTVQRELFIELSSSEKIIVDLLQEKESMHIDEINSRSSMSNSEVAGVLLGLELKNAVISKPGKLYCLS